MSNKTPNNNDCHISTSNSHSDNVLVTFDIDGTLLIGKNKGGEHLNSFKAAIYDLFGFKGDVPKYAPGTDIGISKQIIDSIIKSRQIENNSQNNNDTNICSMSDELLQKFVKKTEDHYSEFFDGEVDIMPGIVESLEGLSNIYNAKIAVCTGNFKGIALQKIEKAGLSKYFTPYVIGGFGNNFESRTDILKEAHQNAEKVFGIKFDRFIHVGDSPSDIESANEIGTTSVLVQTTPFDFNSTDYQIPSFVFTNLKDNYDDFISVVKTGRATDIYYEKMANKKEYK